MGIAVVENYANDCNLLEPLKSLKSLLFGLKDVDIGVDKAVVLNQTYLKKIKKCQDLISKSYNASSAAEMYYYAMSATIELKHLDGGSEEIQKMILSTRFLIATGLLKTGPTGYKIFLYYVYKYIGYDIGKLRLFFYNEYGLEPEEWKKLKKMLGSLEIFLKDERISHEEIVVDKEKGVIEVPYLLLARKILNYMNEEQEKL